MSMRSAPKLAYETVRRLITSGEIPLSVFLDEYERPSQLKGLHWEVSDLSSRAMCVSRELAPFEVEIRALG